MMVNLGRSRRRVRAAGPLPKITSRQKSSIAGYSVSSTTLFKRCISSINNTSPSIRLVRIEAKSPERSMAGPVVVRMLTPSSAAKMWARVVLPKPGGP